MLKQRREGDPGRQPGLYVRLNFLPQPLKRLFHRIKDSTIIHIFGVASA